MTNAAPTPDLATLIERVSLMVDEIKLVNLNLTIANARLRLTDNAFQAVGGSFRQLLEAATDTQDSAEIALKRARGDALTDEEKQTIQKELDQNLERIRQAAENIINTVLAIKKGQRINREA
jgi:hypothetical protein